MADETQTTTITIKEFRMWLQGVEEMQDAAWVPSPTQWQRIREKIDTIRDEVPQAGQVGNQSLQHIAPPVSIPGNEYPVQMATPSLLSLVPSNASIPRNMNHLEPTP